jgi:hypothetical protein
MNETYIFIYHRKDSTLALEHLNRGLGFLDSTHSHETKAATFTRPSFAQNLETREG